MTSILIDYKIVLKTNKLKALYKAPETSKGYEPGLILLMNNINILKSLEELILGDKRISFIDSENFLKNIKAHFWVLYNEKKKIAILDSKIYNYLSDILPCLLSGLDNSTILWVLLPLEDTDFTAQTQAFISQGFTNPYITTLTPMGTPIGDPTKAGVSLSRENIPRELNSSSDVLNKVYHVIEQYKKNDGVCSLYARLSQRAVEFLKKTSKMGITMNKDGKKSQKELTGELYVRDVVRDPQNMFVYVIDINKNSIASGEEENVNVSPTRYNFHSHPHEAYVRHSVDKAWPSQTDYLGYHKLGKNTIFHCVATLEGVYILSFGAYWGSHLNEIKRDFIAKHYDIDHKEKYTPEEYVEKVNSIMYKGKPIYEVRFFSWDKAGSVFEAYFSQINSSCLMSQKIVENYNKIYK